MDRELFPTHTHEPYKAKVSFVATNPPPPPHPDQEGAENLHVLG